VTALTHLQSPLRQLNELSTLQAGWNYGQGSSTSLVARMHATAILLSTALAGASSFEFFPEEDGGILVIAYRANESFEILATSDGRFEVAFEDGTGLSPAKKLDSLNEVQEELEHHGWQSQKSSGSFTHAITATGRVDTHRLRFDPLSAGFPSSTQDVSRAWGIQFVPMRSVIIPAASGDHPRYFGESRRRNLLQVAG
jgi:hypothetical protein